jgi:hypothetical protein
MNARKPLFIALALCLTFAAATTPSQAQEHPAYLHALSDLRLMRAYIDRLTPNDRVDDESMQAIQEIDAAIREIREASIDDHKDLRDHMPIAVSSIAPWTTSRRPTTSSTTSCVASTPCNPSATTKQQPRP